MDLSPHRQLLFCLQFFGQRKLSKLPCSSTQTTPNVLVLMAPRAHVRFLVHVLESYQILLFAVTSRKFWPWKVRLATTKVDDGKFLLALSGEWFETTAYSVSIELEGGDFAMWGQGCKCISLWYFGCPISSEFPRLGTFWLIWKLRRDSMTLLQCVYPLGVAKNANLIVSRKATEVTSFSNLKRKRKKRPKQSESEVRCSIFIFLSLKKRYWVVVSLARYQLHLTSNSCGK